MWINGIMKKTFSTNVVDIDITSNNPDICGYFVCYNTKKAAMEAAAKSGIINYALVADIHMELKGTKTMINQAKNGYIVQISNLGEKWIVSRNKAGEPAFSFDNEADAMDKFNQLMNEE